VIRVMLVDDHAVVRGGLAQLVESAGDMEVVGTAADGAQAVEVARAGRPDVILMDLQMPEMDGVAATRALLDEGMAAQVVILTSYSDAERIIGAIDAGAVGYLLKDADPDEILEGIRAANRGESPLHPRAARELLTSRRSTLGGDRAPQLTGRELEVLRLVRQGLANKQIARRLGISERTVKAHLTSVFQRLDVADRTQAALWAERNGL
jgi:DNA-binding NarL/FixJ family response regulator